MNENTEPMLRQWLLHQLPADQVRLLEQRLLQDEDFGASLRAVETDLLDDYVRGRLSAADHAAVARHLLATPRDRERLRFAAALAQYPLPSPAATRNAEATRRNANIPPAHRPPRRWRMLAWGGLASACAVLIALAVLMHRSVEEAPGAATATPFTIALADPERGASVTEIRIPQGIDKIRLQAEIGSAAPQQRYTLTISDGGHTLFRAPNLAPHEAAPYSYVQAMIPGQTLGNGEHRVTVALQGTTTATIWSIRTHSESKQVSGH